MSLALPPHPGLKRLIHGTGALVAAASVLAGLYCIGRMLCGALEGGRGSLGWLGAIAAILIVGLFFSVVFITGYRMYQKITKNTLSDFAFLCAVLIAMAFYHSLPAHLPHILAFYHINDPFPEHDDHGPGLTYRGMWSFGVWYIFWKLIKAYLLQVFNPDSTVQKLSSDDSNIPEFPKRSPLVEL